jgi:hypothetical protein
MAITRPEAKIAAALFLKSPLGGPFHLADNTIIKDTGNQSNRYPGRDGVKNANITRISKPKRQRRNKNRATDDLRRNVLSRSQMTAETGMIRKSPQYITMLKTLKTVSTVKKSRTRIDKERRTEHNRYVTKIALAGLAVWIFRTTYKFGPFHTLVVTIPIRAFRFLLKITLSGS